MWVAEFRIWHKSPFLEATRGRDVVMHGYYLNAFIDRRGRRWISKVAIMEGRDAQKAIDDWTKAKELRLLEVQGNQLFYQVPELAGFHVSVLDKGVFLLKPQIAKDGFEYWTIGSTDKKSLLKLYGRVRKLGPRKATIEILGMRQEKLNFFAPGALNGLTQLQRRAAEMAFANGYYEYPRKANAERLAEVLRVPRTTLTEHLRKAEVKIMRAVLGGTEVR